MTESLKKHSEDANTVGDERLDKEAGNQGESWLGEDIPEFNEGVSSGEIGEATESEAGVESEVKQQVDSATERQKSLEDMNKQELATEYLGLLKGFSDHFVTTDESVKKYREQHTQGVFMYGQLRIVQQLAQGRDAEATAENASGNATEEMRVADAMVSRLLFIREAKVGRKRDEQKADQLAAEVFDMRRSLARLLKRSEFKEKQLECDRLVEQSQIAGKVIDRCKIGIEDGINWLYGQDGPETSWPRPEADRNKHIQAFMNEYGEELERAVDLREKLDIPQQYDLAMRVC